MMRVCVCIELSRENPKQLTVDMKLLWIILNIPPLYIQGELTYAFL